VHRLGDFQSIKLGALKVNDLTAANTVEMMVQIEIRVKASGFTKSLNDAYDACFGKREKRSVHSIKRDAREFPPDAPEHRIS
jgi:hypothetical protein